jgi:hypothetical protein
VVVRKVEVARFKRKSINESAGSHSLHGLL